MADIQKTTSEYSFALAFADGDTRTLKIPEPNNSLIAESVTSVINTLITNNILIGDKTGAAISSVESISRIDKTVTEFDLSQ